MPFGHLGGLNFANLATRGHSFKILGTFAGWEIRMAVSHETAIPTLT